MTSVMTPLLEKTDHVLASWGFSRGNTMHSKPGEGGSTSQAEVSGKTGDPDVDASNSVTSVVTPLLEKTDNYLATWGLTTSATSPKAESETAVQVSCSLSWSSFFTPAQYMNLLVCTLVITACMYTLW